MSDQKIIFSRKDIRQLTYLVVFGIFIILFQVFQFLNTKSVNERYYEIINNRNKLIISVNSILLESSILQRSIINLGAADSVNVKDLAAKVSGSVEKIENNIAIIKSDTIISNERVSSLFDKLKNDYQVYKTNFQNYIQKADAKAKEYNSDTRKEMRRSLETLQTSQSDFLELLVKIENIEIGDISKKTNKAGWLLLIAGNAVLLIILVFLVYILITEKKQAV